MLNKFSSILPGVTLNGCLFVIVTASLKLSLLKTSSDMVIEASDGFSICLARSAIEAATCCGSFYLRSLVQNDLI